jgi:hypothetical protein
VSEPDRVRVVPRELLEALAAEAPSAQAGGGPASSSGQKPAASGRPRSRLLVERWLEDRGVAYRRKGQPDDKGRDVYPLKECPFDSSHGDPDSCIMQAPDGEMSAHCFHASCHDHGWQAFKDKIGAPEAHHYDPPLSGKGGKRGRRRKGPRAAEIILDYFKRRYGPVFKRGNVVHCADGSALTQGVACGVPDSPLIERLAKAGDAPRDGEGRVKRGALPKFFASQAKVSWGDLLDGLPVEDDVAPGDDRPAREEFRQLVRDALLSEVVLGKTIRGAAVTQVERRSLIDWCKKFAKTKKTWQSIRSKRCWCRLKKLEGGEVELQVAVRQELFGQLKADKRLADLTPRAFARRCRRYGVGTSTPEERPHGLTAVVLDPAFVRELTAGGPADPVDPDQPAEREPGQEG